jgi:hypothetical protein
MAHLEGGFLFSKFVTAFQLIRTFLDYVTTPVRGTQLSVGGNFMPLLDFV